MTIREEAPREQARAGNSDDLTGLLSRIAARDAVAFAVLYKQTNKKLYGVVARIVTRGDVASDVLQEAYLRIWERAGEFDPIRGSPPAWMSTIARNCAIDEVRRVRPWSFAGLTEEDEPAAVEVDPLAARERSEDLAALIHCLKALDEEKRAAVLLAYCHGLSREALAKRFGRPVPTVKTWLHRSLRQLKDCLARADPSRCTLCGKPRSTIDPDDPVGRSPRR